MFSLNSVLLLLSSKWGTAPKQRLHRYSIFPRTKPLLQVYATLESESQFDSALLSHFCSAIRVGTLKYEVCFSLWFLQKWSWQPQAALFNFFYRLIMYFRFLPGYGLCWMRHISLPKTFLLTPVLWNRVGQYFALLSSLKILTFRPILQMATCTQPNVKNRISLLFSILIKL